MSSELKIDNAMGKRLQAFIRSDLFIVRSGIAKSEYWKHHADQLIATVSDETVSVEGVSGFYVPKKASAFQRAVRKVQRAFLHPSKVIEWAAGKIKSRLGTPRLMSYEQAFDAVMSCAEVAEPILSPFRINHAKLAKHPKVFADTQSVKRHYQNWSGYEATPNIINHYYYQNILRGFAEESQIRTVLEIGAGNGNFPSILHHDWAQLRVILVDLPETLAVAIPFLSNLFPGAKLLLPNEAQDQGLSGSFDFAFLTVDQLNIIADNSIDLAINCHSFQEMTHEQIKVYFQLVQRVCRESGLFFAASRVEKIPCGPDALTVEQTDRPNRFAEFPWNSHNEELVYEVSRLSRLVQLDGVSIRLERIHK
jgi:putative sugar O-methyltransferase